MEIKANLNSLNKNVFLLPLEDKSIIFFDNGKRKLTRYFFENKSTMREEVYDSIGDLVISHMEYV